MKEKINSCLQELESTDEPLFELLFNKDKSVNMFINEIRYFLKDKENHNINLDYSIIDEVDRLVSLIRTSNRLKKEFNKFVDCDEVNYIEVPQNIYGLGPYSITCNTIIDFIEKFDKNNKNLYEHIEKINAKTEYSIFMVEYESIREKYLQIKTLYKK